MDNDIHQKQVRAWCLYDWANSAFMTSVVAAVLPIFFRNVAAASLPESQSYLATSIWGYTAALAMLISAFLSLLFGTLADAYGSRKKYFTFFLMLGCIATAILSFTGYGDYIPVALLFLVASIGFAGSELFYESFLPHLANKDEIDRISSKGYAWGYLGGGILLVLNLVAIFVLPKQSIANNQVPVLGMQLTFLSVALWWGLFSIPFIRNVPEPLINSRESHSLPIIKESFLRLSSTFKEIKKYKQLFLFLLAFWCYNDGIGTIMKMATLYGSDIGIETMDLIGALVLTQFIGIPCAFLFGRLADRLGTKQGILIGIGGYLIITIGGFFMQTALHFWILAGMVGMVQGGTQALSRSLYGSMVPKLKSAEFFSFYNISGKFAGMFGPFIFGLFAQLLKNSRFGILSLISFFVLGGIILLRVDVKEGRKIQAT